MTFAPIWFNLPLFGPKIQLLSIFSLTYLHVPLFTYIWLYLVIFALNCFELTIWAIFTLQSLHRGHRYSSIETAPLSKMLEQSDNYSWRYCISKNWKIHTCSVFTNVVWVFYLVIENFVYAPSRLF